MGALDGPFVVGLEQQGADQTGVVASLGRMPTTSARRLALLFSRSIGLVAGMR